MIIPRKIYIRDKKIKIRNLEPDDAGTFLHVRKATTDETYYMARYPEEIKTTIEEAEEMIKTVNASGDELLIGAFWGNTMVGCAGFSKVGTHIKFRHKAGMFISIMKDYCDGGLGTEMLITAIDAAKKTSLEQLVLGVFDNNSRAYHVYTKLGFREWGREPRAFKMKDGTYHDEIQMVLFLKSTAQS
jgi:RimJ/RimL family protein N-acetyltransferase